MGATEQKALTEFALNDPARKFKFDSVSTPSAITLHSKPSAHARMRLTIA